MNIKKFIVIIADIVRADVIICRSIEDIAWNEY